MTGLSGCVDKSTAEFYEITITICQGVRISIKKKKQNKKKNTHTLLAVFF